MNHLRAGLAAIATAATLSGGLAGCSASPPDLTAADLQNRIVRTLNEGGTQAASASCPGNLPAKLGASVRCEVTFSPTDQVQAVATTISVAGAEHEYEIAPRLTRGQVETRVAAMSSAQSAACDSGLEAVVGDWTKCVLTQGGATAERTVEVTEVDGLRLGLRSSPVLNREQLAEALSRKLAASGRAPDSTQCVAGLPAEKGVATECTATTAGKKSTYTLTVTGFSDEAIDFAFVPNGQNTPTVSPATPQPTAPESTPSQPATGPPAPPLPAPAPPPVTAAPEPTQPPRGAFGEQ